MIKIMAGLLPAAPITGELLDAQISQVSISDSESDTEGDSRYADYEGPTMEEEIASHSGSVPDLRGTEVYNVQVGDDFNPLAGVYAIDSQDGDITENIEITSDNVDTSQPGSYTVEYRVENSRGGWYEYTRSIEVSNASTDPVPMIPPTEAELEGDSEESEEASASSAITFIGLEDITIQQDEEFNPKEDVEIIDVDGSDITHRAYISGEVDTNTPGEYTIAYAVFDHFGDPHAKARTITVE
ncbi:immunoglobulin-like domain-containing protein [Salinicoccus hispanicus]|uniref:immunoglobulin-like domain-containing protein n=1 Tax=Salinicoccus hispanicus TaxID=157225 RepID=UPI002ADDC42C|nr:immunoglobulin-like domain-containing protein [Salinicoccus hispanicus]